MLWSGLQAQFPSHHLLSYVTSAVYVAHLPESQQPHMLGGWKETGYKAQSGRVPGWKFISLYLPVFSHSLITVRREVSSS